MPEDHSDYTAAPRADATKTPASNGGEYLKGKFWKIPIELGRADQLSDGAKLTYGALRWLSQGTGRARTSLAKLASFRGLSRWAIEKHLRQLRRGGLLATNPHSGDTNDYRLTLDPSFYMSSPLPPGQPSGGVPDNRPGGAGQPSGGIHTEPFTELTTEQPSPFRRRQEQTTPLPPFLPTTTTKPTPERPNSHQVERSHEVVAMAASVPYASDRDRFIMLYLEVTGELPELELVNQVEQVLIEQQQSLARFVEDVRPRLERLRAKPGPGFFLTQARKLGAGSLRPVRVKVIPAATHIPAVDEPRCAECGLRFGRGIGVVPRGKEFVSCPACLERGESSHPPIQTGELNP